MTFTNTRLATYRTIYQAVKGGKGPRKLNYFEVKVSGNQATFRACDGHRVFQDSIDFSMPVESIEPQDGLYHFEIEPVMATLKGIKHKDRIVYTLEFWADGTASLRAHDTREHTASYIKAVDVDYPDLDRVMGSDNAPLNFQLNQGQAFELTKKLKWAGDYKTMIDFQERELINFCNEYNQEHAIRVKLNGDFETRHKAEPGRVSPVLNTVYLQQLLKRHDSLSVTYEDTGSPVRVSDGDNPPDVIMPISQENWYGVKISEWLS